MFGYTPSELQNSSLNLGLKLIESRNRKLTKNQNGRSSENCLFHIHICHYLGIVSSWRSHHCLVCKHREAFSILVSTNDTPNCPSFREHSYMTSDFWIGR